METTSTTTPRPATRDATPPSSPRRPPLAVLRFGPVSAAVFETEIRAGGRTVPLRTVSLRRAYRDASGTLRYTARLRPQDLLPAAYALLKAFDLVEGGDGTPA